MVDRSSDELAALASDIRNRETTVRMWIAEGKQGHLRFEKAIEDVCQNCQQLMGESFRRIASLERGLAFLKGLVGSAAAAVIVVVFRWWFARF